jgi:hypothetical protein
LADNDNTGQTPGDDQAPDSAQTQAPEQIVAPSPAPQTDEPPREEIELTPPDQIGAEEPEPAEQPEAEDERKPWSKRAASWLCGPFASSVKKGWKALPGNIFVATTTIVTVVLSGVVCLIAAGILLGPAVFVDVIWSLFGSSISISAYILITLVWAVTGMPMFIRGRINIVWNFMSGEDNDDGDDDGDVSTLYG